MSSSHDTAGTPAAPTPPHRMIRSWPSLIIGLVVPTVALLGGVAVFGSIDAVILGFPVVFAWVFFCFLLTTACLWTSWHFFDRHHHLDEEATR